MCFHDRFDTPTASSSSSRAANTKLHLAEFDSYNRRKIQVGDKDNAMQNLAKTMQRNYGLVPLILVAVDRKDKEFNFSMFVDPSHVDGIQKAAHDLRSWHPRKDFRSYNFSEVSHSAIGLTDRYGQHERHLLEDIPFIKGRNTPDSLDFDEKDHLTAYHRCRANGYVSDWLHNRNLNYWGDKVEPSRPRP